MSAEPDVVERLRIEAKWLQSAKHASNEVIKAGLLMENAADEITCLRARLEMNVAYQMIDGVMTKIAVEPGFMPDGIECRDETIKLQDNYIKDLRSQNATMREAANELLHASPADYWDGIVTEVKAAGTTVRFAILTNHQAAHLLAWATIARSAALASTEAADE